jgi:D-alanyl-D-alanine carboxypeptidase
MLALAAAAGLVPGLAPRLASAQIGSARYSSIIVDNGSGRVIEAANADAPRYPASLTKLMTLYMAFEALRDHRIALGQRVPVSGRAASMEPSKLGLVPGTYFTVSDAILAIVTKSANDAACALGELIGGGDEDRFAQMMTLRARALGMTNSTFRNASGLPDPDQITTARDLALLAHHLIQDFPDQYHYFSEPVFYFHGQAIPNHDRMLTAYEGADGLKTGYTQAAGHNLVTSALRGQVRLIGVVMGARSNPERDAHMANLLDDGFEQLGVPVTRHAAPRFRMPSLIASAEASTLTAAGYHPTLGRRQWRLHGHVAQVARHRGDPPLRATLAVARGPILSHGSLAHGSLAHAGMAHPGMAHASLSHASLAHAPRHLVAAHALSTCAARTLHHACGPHPREKRRT